MPELPEIPGYKLIKSEGKGPVGTVFRGRADKGGGLVAIKQVSRQLTAHQQFRRRLRSDLKNVARVHHPNIAHPIELGRVGERYFCITEFVEGDTVRERIREQHQMPELDARKLILDAARGLAEAARAGVVHYDLKPSNLLVSESGDVKVTDFMFDYHRYVGSVPSEQVYEMMEFPLYMSPEERELKQVTERSNIFSLGAVFFHMLYDQPIQSMTGERLPAPELSPDRKVSEQTLEILDLMLAADPDDRFEEMEDVVHALEKRALPKIDLMEASLYAAVFVVLFLTVGLMARGLSKIEEAPKVLNPQIPVFERPVEKLEEVLMQEAEDFSFRFPERTDEALLMFQKVVGRFPGTRFSVNAQERIDSIRTAQRHSQATEWAELEKNMQRFLKQDLYIEIQKVAERYEVDHPNSAHLTDLSAFIKRTERAQQTSFDEVLRRVSKLVSVGKFERAEKELEFVAQNFADESLRRKAISHIGQVQRERTEERATPAPVATPNKSEVTRFRKFAEEFHELTGSFRYLAAFHLCNDATESLKENELLRTVQHWQQLLGDDQVFVEQLLDRIERTVPKPTLLRGTSKHNVYDGDWTGVTVSSQNKIMYEWKSFSRHEIYGLVIQIADRAHADEQFSLVRFCVLRGMWAEAESRLDTALSLNPTLSKESRELMPTAQIMKLLRPE